MAAVIRGGRLANARLWLLTLLTGRCAAHGLRAGRRALGVLMDHMSRLALRVVGFWGESSSAAPRVGLPHLK